MNFRFLDFFDNLAVVCNPSAVPKEKVHLTHEKEDDVVLPIARKKDLVVQESGGEILVYDLKVDKAFCLNRTSALVWLNCDGNKNALEIAGILEREMGSPVTEDFVLFALSELNNENLLEDVSEIVNLFRGISRRQVIKKVGLSSLIALPVIASLTVPVAAQIASCQQNAPGCAAPGIFSPGSCATSNDCCSCNCRDVITGIPTITCDP